MIRIRRTGRSIIGLARSRDGFRLTADAQPFLVPERAGPFAAYEELGVEDPRVTRLEEWYIITYSAYSRSGVRIALAGWNREDLLGRCRQRDVCRRGESVGSGGALHSTQ